MEENNQEIIETPVPSSNSPENNAPIVKSPSHFFQIIVAIFCFIVGLPLFLLPVSMAVFVIPQLMQLYSSLNVEPAGMPNLYLGYAGLLFAAIVGLVNMFFGIKVIKNKNYLNRAIIVSILSFGLMGISIAFSIISIVNPIYGLVSQINDSNEQGYGITPIPAVDQNQTIDTSKWIPYQSSKYGYTIKLPPGMQYESKLSKDYFYQGLEAEGPNLLIEFDYKLQQSPSDTVSTFKIAGQSLTKLSGPTGVRIGPLKHNGHAFGFFISGKNKTEKDFGDIYQILSTFKFTN